MCTKMYTMSEFKQQLTIGHFRSIPYSQAQLLLSPWKVILPVPSLLTKHFDLPKGADCDQTYCMLVTVLSAFLWQPHRVKLFPTRSVNLWSHQIVCKTDQISLCWTIVGTPNM